MIPPILTLLLLAFAVLLGVRVGKLRSALPMLLIAWVVVMVVNFVVAGVADDDDIGAFVGSAFIVLLLCIALWRLGVWFKHLAEPFPRETAIRGVSGTFCAVTTETATPCRRSGAGPTARVWRRYGQIGAP